MAELTLSERMKMFYESRAQTSLVNFIPVVIRLDGKAAHTFTKGFKKPFDECFSNAMVNTLLYLCKNIQNCRIGYTQSDEISLILLEPKINSQSWFDNKVQKIVSIASSMCTLWFNRYFQLELEKYQEEHYKNEVWDDPNLAKAYAKALNSGLLFDARCFNIPKEEVVNMLIWRQSDAYRNSIQSIARYLYGHKQILGKSNKELVEQMEKEGIDLMVYGAKYLYGSCVLKDDEGKWRIDENTPMFQENKNYINNSLKPLNEY